MKKLVNIILSSLLLASNLSILSAKSEKTPTLKILTETKYDDVGNYSDGILRATDNDRMDFLDEDGNEKFSVDIGFSGKELETVGDFNDGILYFKGSSIGQTRYINTKGEFLDVFKSSEYDVEDGTEYNDGTAILWSIKDDLVVSDLKGKETKIDFRRKLAMDDSESISHFAYNDDLIAVNIFDKDGEIRKGVFVDKDFNIVVDKEFEQVGMSLQGYLPFMKDDKWGFADKDGKVLIEAKYDEYYFDNSNKELFTEGIARAKKNNKFYLINKDGNETPVSADCDAIYAFQEDLALVRKDATFGYIDKNGNMSISTNFGDANSFSNGSALAKKDGKYNFYDKYGEVITNDSWEFEDTKLLGKTDLVWVKSNNKWGLAKITDDTETDTSDISTQTAEEIENQDEISETNFGDTTNETKVIFKDKVLVFDLPIQNKNDRTYYPFRELITGIGGEAEWLSEEKKAKGTLDGKTVIFSLNSKTYNDNGEDKTMDAEAYLDNERVYIPIRYACEALGLSVDFDTANKTIIIK